MANESKTTRLFRSFLQGSGYYDKKEIIIEEQQSDNAKIAKLLKNASKRGMGKGFPDFIIYSSKYSEFVIVVECKADINKHESNMLDNYKDYAVDGAFLYASFLSKEYDVLSIAISGESEEKHRVSHFLQLKGEKQGHRIFSDKIMSLEDYYEGINQSNYKFNQDYSKLVIYTKTLNEHLHAKKIKESQRALLISGILIALKDKSFEEGFKKHRTIKQLINTLYVAIIGQLTESDIPAKRIDALTQAFTFIKTNPTLNDANNGKEFLEKLIEEIDKEINGFMITHKYVDTVSQFYVEFLRYANNDKGLGIVLTPPHITELFTDLADVNKNSVVYDNCCGTGGFLISAMKRMLFDAKGDKLKERDIRGNQLIGVEFQDDIYTLLVSNMIIHRDGRTNIFLGDCFEVFKEVQKLYKPDPEGKIKLPQPDIGLLNPPYKTKASDIEEFEFILNNLEVLAPGGTCVAIIPISCVIERGIVPENLRKRLLEKHTLEAVLSLPEELFHNSKVNTVTCAVIATAHKPHPQGKKTWFAYCRDDGFIKVKNKGRIDANHTWDSIKASWVNAYRNREIIDGFSLMREVRASDEWCVEAYLETDYSSLSINDYEETVRKFMLFNMNGLSEFDEGDENDDEDM